MADKQDISFVYSVWLRSYKHDSPITSKINSSIFFEEHHKLLDQVLSNPKVIVVLAVDSNDPEYIVGFIAVNKVDKVIHFSYTKKPLRKFGVFNMLCDALEIPRDLFGWEVTHLTFTLLELWNHKKTLCKYNPYKLERMS